VYELDKYLKKGKIIVGTLNHHLWTIFSRHLVNSNKYPRVITYVNVQLVQLYFSFGKNIVNHKDLNIISFFNNSIIFFIINIYFDEQKSALKYLKDIEVNLNNVLIFTGDFNIRDRE